MLEMLVRYRPGKIIFCVSLAHSSEGFVEGDVHKFRLDMHSKDLLLKSLSNSCSQGHYFSVMCETLVYQTQSHLPGGHRARLHFYLLFKSPLIL